MITLDNIVEKFIFNATEEIKNAMQTNLFQDMPSMVIIQSTKFKHQMQGNAGNNLHCNFFST